MRTATSKTFQNDDGSFTTSVFSGPVHFRDDRRWKEIDTELVPADAPGFAYRNAAAEFRALFKEELDPGFMRFVAGGRAFDFTLDAAARGSSNRSKSGLAYRDAFPGVDLSYDVVPDGVKETLVLDDARAPSRYRFYLDTEDAGSLSVEKLPNGAWAFRERRADEPLFVLDPPYAIDAADSDFELPPAAAPEPTPSPTPSPSPDFTPSPSETTGEGHSSTSPVPAPPASPDVTPLPSVEESPPHTPAPPDKTPRARQAAAEDAREKSQPDDTHAALKVTRTGDRFAVDLAVDAQWLHAQERAFPVLVDPSITIQPSLEDANFNATCPTCLPSLWDLNYIGTTSKDAWRTALQFDLGDIPAGAAQITNAKLKLYYETCVPGSCRDRSHQIDVHRMTSAWSTSSATQELSFDATPLASYTLGAGADPAWMTWDLTGTVKNWLSGTQNNFGVLAKRSTDATLGQSGPAVPGRRYTKEPTLRPALEVTWTADAVTLGEPSTLHSNGAELSWTTYAGTSSFTSYEVHRSAMNRFTPGPGTLLAAIGAKTTTTYRDTTAAPSKSFTYKIVTNGNVSNERTVTLPANGQATKVLQPGAATKGTYVTKDTGYTVCDDNGARDKLYVGSESTYVRRPILEFALGEIPASAIVTNASLSLWHGSTNNFAGTVNAHRVTSAWQEGSGAGSCTRDGATWYSVTGTVPWASQGGDYDPAVAGWINHPVPTSIPGWDSFDLTALVGNWVSGKAPNHGILLKLADETLAAGRSFAYWSDDFSASPTLQPRLTIQYTEPVTAQAPTVKISGPGEGAGVSGSVLLAAAASDDRRVDKVEFLIDGSVVATDTTVPFEASWASTSVANGNHTLSARATDDAGNVTTSTAITLNVGNSNAPTVSVTAPASGANVAGPQTLSASASDDVAVSKVEFLVDGIRIGDPMTASPYTVSWNTLDPAQPFYDGSHDVTAKAYDGHGNVTTSAPVTVNVANGAGSKFKASIGPTSAVPQAMTYDPAKITQDTHGITVSITNTSGVAWDPADIVWRYRWIGPTGPAAYNQYTFGTSFPSGTTRTRTIQVPPPTLPAGADKSEYTLRFDLYSLTSAAWFADKGNKPSDHPILVNKAIEATALGLEKYYQYEGEPVGAGMTHLTNVASGNALLRWSPFYAPGRGLSTAVDITYNSLEDKSDSPIGNNFSLGISGLTRFGLPLDVHPNNADTLAGRSNKYIELADSDGTTHRFTANANGGWDEPPGVHLYLREYSTTDPQRKWALTRPDRVTFFYDNEGFPTSVQDKNGNRIEYTWENIPPGEDPGGVKRRITKVTDAGGLAASPAPNRSFDIDYYSKSEAKKPQVRGKIEKITDHSGSALVFDYYDDGNLLRLTQKGGTNADGSFLSDRSFVFTYTTPDESAAAIPLAGNRLNPSTKTNQSSRLFSVRDPRGNETTFTYYGPSSSQLRWKLQSRTNRGGKTTSFAYDLANRLTTVTAPMSRVTKFAYDTQGKATAITNPRNETTAIAWTSDRHVWKVTEPTGEYTEFAYNDNGYVTDVWDQLRNQTTLEYQNVAVDANDISTTWRAGRTIPHVSQLVKKTDPEGTATATPTDDFQHTFEYDTKGNLTKVIEPEGVPAYTTTYTYNTDGTVATVTNARGFTTTYANYEANGLATTITDAENQVTKLGFDDDGLLRWVQDARHASSSGGDPRRYRTYFDYDSFHRLGRQSMPKLTAPNDAWPLIWSATSYDANDNVLSSFAPEDGYQFVRGPETKMTYDAMDAVLTSTNPENHKTELTYDAAGRQTKVTTPKGVATPVVDKDYAVFFEYDALDRVERRITYDTAPATPKALTTHYCFNTAGDLASVTAPKADVTSVNCTTPPSYTTKFTYDDAHRRTIVENPLGHQTKWSYDRNGNVKTATDALLETATFTYDERSLLTKKVEPFNGTRSIITRYEYDGMRNLTKLISPRAHDSGLDSLATRYTYDKVDRQTVVQLPRLATEPQTYIHRAYDGVGNVVKTSLPVTTAPGTANLWSVTPLEMQTAVDYFDTGLPLKTEDNVNPAVTYEYNARGLQTKRSAAGRSESWIYYDDDMLRQHNDLEDDKLVYTYDPNNNLASATDSTGIRAASQKPVKIEVIYDTLEQVDKVRHRPETGVATDKYDFTSFDYDLNGNVIERWENGKENPDQSPDSPGKRHTFVYDQADRLQLQLDYLTTGCQKVENEFNALGLEVLRKVSKSPQTCDTTSSGFTVEQTTLRDFYKNQQIKTLRTVNGNVDTTTARNPVTPAVVIERHDVEYVDLNGNYVNGNRTKDMFFRARPTGTECDTAGDNCAAKYTYDGRDRILTEDRGHPGTDAVTTYVLNNAGSVLEETTGTAKTSYVYDGLQMVESTTGVGTPSAKVFEYYYDPFGNLDCVTDADESSCPKPGDVDLVRDYTWDGLNRLWDVESWSNGTQTDDTTYIHDALDRVVQQTESHAMDATAKNRTTDFSYLGLSHLVTKETFQGNNKASDDKTYSYDAFNQRVSMVDDPSGTATAKTYTYGYDVHGSVSTLLDDSTGQVKASYAYDAYGGKDSKLSAGDDTDVHDPLNAYRYSARRFDTGSESLDMGARRFGPDSQTFLQPDRYAGALANLGLSMDPLTGNRYALAAGNPVGFAEVDGHKVAAVGPRLGDDRGVVTDGWAAGQAGDGDNTSPAKDLSEEARTQTMATVFDHFPGDSNARWGHGQGIMDFIGWMRASGRLDPQTGSPLWRSVNGGISADAWQALAKADKWGGYANSPDPVVQKWLDYFKATEKDAGAKRENALLWEAHQASLHRAIRQSATLRLLEPEREQKFFDIVVANVDWTAIQRAPMGNPGVRMWTSSIYADSYPISEADYQRALSYQIPCESLCGIIGINSTLW